MVLGTYRDLDSLRSKTKIENISISTSFNISNSYAAHLGTSKQ